MNITDIINKNVIQNDKTAGSIANVLKIDQKTLQNIAKVALPVILYSIYKNTKSKEGAESLSKALNDHKKDDISDTDKYLENLDEADSKRMLDRVFSKNKDAITKTISGKAGVGADQVEDILAKLTPIVVSMLAKDKDGVLDEEQVKQITKAQVENVKEHKDFNDIFPKAREYVNSGANPSIFEGLKDLLGGFRK